MKFDRLVFLRKNNRIISGKLIFLIQRGAENDRNHCRIFSFILSDLGRVC
jgi:hypothetical protein